VAENVTYLMVTPYTDRLDYLAAMNNNLGYALGVERLIGEPVPERAQYIRVMMAELNRIASHLLAIGTFGMDLGAITPFLLCFRDREFLLKLFETVCGQRLNYTYIRPGGVAYDLTDGLLEKVQAFCDYFPPKVHELNELLSENGIFIERTAGVGTIPAAMAIDYGLTGPNLRASGVPRDLRKDAPYDVYGVLDFDVIVGRGAKGVLGDCWDRYDVRVRELLECVKIVRQCVARMSAGEHLGKPYAKNIRPKAAEVYSRCEGARGEVGFYIVSTKGPNPYRVKCRAPSFCNISILDALTPGVMVADLVAILGSLDIVMGEVDR
jgi:NADH-quinone oxidoreductase subunit D